MESRRMVLINLFSGQQWRYKYREQGYGPGRERGRRGWDEWTEWHGSRRTDTGEIDSQWKFAIWLRELRPRLRCWSWNSSTLATWCEELTHLKRLWCWERLRAGGEGDDRGWDGWMASLTQKTWVWVDSGSWWWTGRPGVLWFMGSQRVGHDWVTELNWPLKEEKLFHQVLVYFWGLSLHVLLSHP